MKVLIAAGGTGGHIIPALAVANALIAQKITVHWLGTQQGLEHQLIPPTGIPIHYIQVQGIRGKGFAGLLAAPFRMLRATWQALDVIRSEQPDLVMGFGGFVSGPCGLAAWLLKKPLIIQEQNAIAGFTNRCLAHLAKYVFQAFPNTFNPRYHAITSGNPVREEIVKLPAPEERFANRNGPLRILILGGSQGAAVLNKIIPAAIATFPMAQRPEILHSAGKRFAAETQAIYQQHDVQAHVVAFIDDMANAYAWADLVICRAGALSVAELAAAGVASILIPYPYAVDDHQTANAAWLVQANAAVCVKQDAFTQEEFVVLLYNLGDRNKLLQMAIAARSIAIPQATTMIVTKCLSIKTLNEE